VQATPTTGKLKVVALSDKVHKLLKDYCSKNGLKMGAAAERMISKYLKK
tara:strand:+ start:336 stop:482 length:147 start_codon:yes stop_codon:yes gene_type:complete